MSIKKNVLRNGLTILGSLDSGIGDPILTQDGTTKEVGIIPTIDPTAYISTSLQNGRLLIGSNTNIATARQVSGMLTISDLGVATIVANTITNSHINSIAGIIYGKLNLTNSIVNTDISTSAGIIRTKLANGTPYRILINNPTGVFSELSPLSSNRLIGSDNNGMPITLNTTITEANYIAGLTSSLQGQLNTRLDFGTVLSPVEGDLAFYNGTQWFNFPRGTSGQYLTSTASTIQWVAVPNGMPTGGTSTQYLRKIDNTDFNTEWIDLTLDKISNVTATFTQVNALANGFYDATSSIQTQLGLKLSASLNYNSLFVGNVSNVAVGLPPGSNGQILTIVTGAPQWQTVVGTGSVTQVDVVGGTTGLTTTGGPYATTGTITLAGNLNPTHGGTGIITYTIGDTLYSSASNVLSKLAIGTTGQVLTVSGGGIPSWATYTGITGLTTNRIPYATSATTLGDDSALVWDATNDAITIGTIRIFSKGTRNLFIGEGAGNFTLTTTDNSVVIGYHAADALTTGDGNIAIGSDSLGGITTGSSNIAIGANAQIIANGSHNISIGENTSASLTSGTYNIIIGDGIDIQSATSNGQLSIQNIIFGVNNTAIGTSISTGNIGIGVITPTARLHLAASTTGGASLRISSGIAPTSPNHGDIWTTTTHLFARLNGVTYQLDQQTTPTINNGLTLVGGTILNWGGILAFDTTISGSGSSYGVDFNSLNFLNISTTNTALQLNSVSFNYTDSQGTPTGITYASDYSASLGTLGLITKGYTLGVKTYTGKQTFVAALTTAASINIPSGITPTTGITNGDIWQNSNHLYTRLNGVTYQLDQQTGGISGLTSGRIPYANSTTTITDTVNLVWDNTNNCITIEDIRLHSKGSFGCFVGEAAGNFTLTGSHNTGIGTNALFTSTSGSRNTAIGSVALSLSTTGSDNVAVGQGAMQAATTAGTSIAIGSGSLASVLTASQNVALGYNSLNLTTGGFNIAIGSSCATTLTTGTNNLFIGYAIEPQSISGNNQLSIQNIIFGLGNSATGTTVSTGTIGIGVVAPTATLHLAASTTSKASLRIVSGTAPTSPNDGDIWYDGTNLFMRISGVTKTFTIV